MDDTQSTAMEVSTLTITSTAIRQRSSIHDHFHSTAQASTTCAVSRHSNNRRHDPLQPAACPFRTSAIAISSLLLRTTETNDHSGHSTLQFAFTFYQDLFRSSGSSIERSNSTHNEAHNSMIYAEQAIMVSGIELTLLKRIMIFIAGSVRHHGILYF